MYAFSRAALYGECPSTFTTRLWQDIHTIPSSTKISVQGSCQRQSNGATERVWVWSLRCGGGADLHTETSSRFQLFIANVENQGHWCGAKEKQRSWVWAQAHYHHLPLISAEKQRRNTLVEAKKLGLSLNSFAVATRRWPTCDHRHHPLISAERQSISARLRELGVKRLALSAACSLPSQPDGS